jgi:hypothetical protein
MIGKRYHRLTVLCDAGIKNGRKMVLCRCECETEKQIEARLVFNGTTKSCGCLQRDISRTTYRKKSSISRRANPLDDADEDIL